MMSSRAASTGVVKAETGAAAEATIAAPSAMKSTPPTMITAMPSTPSAAAPMPSRGGSRSKRCGAKCGRCDKRDGKFPKHGDRSSVTGCAFASSTIGSIGNAGQRRCAGGHKKCVFRQVGPYGAGGAARVTRCLTLSRRSYHSTAVPGKATTAQGDAPRWGWLGNASALRRYGARQSCQNNRAGICVLKDSRRPRPSATAITSGRRAGSLTRRQAPLCVARSARCNMAARAGAGWGFPT